MQRKYKNQERIIKYARSIIRHTLNLVFLYKKYPPPKKTTYFNNNNLNTVRAFLLMPLNLTFFLKLA